MKDPDLEAYLEAIEALLGRRHGAERVLGPRDFAVAQAWHRAGVPLANVLAAIEEAFAAGERVSSLSFCAARVLARTAGPGSVSAGPIPARQRDLAVALGELCEGLMRLATAGRPEAEALLGKVRAASRQLEGGTPTPQLGAALEEIDQEVERLLLQTLPRAALEGHRAASSRALRRAHGRVEPVVLEDALRRLAVGTARERLGLPRVGPGRLSP
jgi:hypothetical protein